MHDDPEETLRRRSQVVRWHATNVLVRHTKGRKSGDQSAERAREGRGWRECWKRGYDVERRRIYSSGGFSDSGDGDDARLLILPALSELGSYGQLVADDQPARARGTGDDVRRALER